MSALRLGDAAPESPRVHGRPSTLKSTIAAVAMSIAALSAKAAPLKLEDMTNAPYMFTSTGVLSMGNSVFDLNDIQLRLASDPTSPIYDTTGTLVFNDDGSLKLLLNALVNGQLTESFSASFERMVEVPENPGVFNVYNGNIIVGGLLGGPDYKIVDFVSSDSGFQFDRIDHVAAVPEPSSIALTGLGLGIVGGAAALRNRRRKEDEANTTPENKVENQEPETV